MSKSREILDEVEFSPLSGLAWQLITPNDHRFLPELARVLHPEDDTDDLFDYMLTDEDSPVELVDHPETKKLDDVRIPNRLQGTLYILRGERFFVGKVARQGYVIAK